MLCHAVGFIAPGFSLRVRAPTEPSSVWLTDSSPHACAVTLRYEAPNGATQSQSQTTALRAQATVAAPARCRGRAGCRLDVSGQPVTGGPTRNQEDGRMGTPTGCYVGRQPVGTQPHTRSPNPASAPKTSALHGAWRVDHRAGALPDAHILSLNAWAKTRMVSRCGPRIGPAIREAAYLNKDCSIEPQGREAARPGEQMSAERTLIYSSRRREKPSFVGHIDPCEAGASALTGQVTSIHGIIIQRLRLQQERNSGLRTGFCLQRPIS